MVRIRSILLCVAVAPLVTAQQNSQVAWWGGTWDAAFAEAKVRNVPVLVVFVQDGEEASERLVNGTFRDPEYVKVTDKTVAIVANREFHGIKKDEAGGVVRAVCAKFGAVPCEAHQTLETPARVELCGTEVRVPQHVIVLPDKTVVERLLDVVPISAYQENVAKASKKLGRGLLAAEMKQLRDHFRDANVRIEKEDWTGALKTVREAAAIAKDTPFMKEVTALVAKIDAEAKKELDQALAAEKKGDALVALRILDGAVTTFAGTDMAPALRKELTRMKNTKPGVEAARTLAKEKKAEPSYAAGEAAEKAKDFIAARREYQRVLSGAPGTPIADKAKLRLDIFEADPDIKALFDRFDKDGKALALVKDAEKLAAAGSKTEARALLQRVLTEYPGTPAAATAKTRLEELR